MLNLTNFDSEQLYTSAQANLDLPNVSLIKATMGLQYNPIHNYANDYFTFIAKENGTFTFTPSNNNVISYSIDEGSTWIVGNSVQVNNGDKVIWKGEMTPAPFTSFPNLGIGSFSTSTNNFDVQGNIMSLLYGDNFKNQIDLSGKDLAFYELFMNTKVVSAENLSLPATTLASGCYSGMFQSCTNLTLTPKLPATTLASNCYMSMFGYCISLTSAPELPATTLADACYRNMLSFCKSLTSAPELPATTLTPYCYAEMFEYSTSLTSAPELPATTLTEGCYKSMFQNCTSLTSAPELPATTLTESCYERMFMDCTNLTTAPELPATTLTESCYDRMFFGCTKLNSITCLTTDISATDCTIYWVVNVASSGTFTKAASMNSWTTGYDGIPSGWTVQDYSE